MIPRYLVDVDLEKLPVVDTDVIVIGAGIAGLIYRYQSECKQ